MAEQRAWFEDDKLWEYWETFILSPRLMDAAPADAENALKLLDIPPGSSMLDLCCGLGRHTIEFARRGYHLTGVDRTKRYLDRARQRAADADLDIEFVHDDMRTFRRPDAFDGVTNLLTSFGYFDDPDEDRRVLDNIHASLKSGGRVVMEVVGKEVLARIYQKRDWADQDGVYCMEEREPIDNWSRLKIRWIFVKDGTTSEFHLMLRLYSAQELTALLTSVGFGDVRSFGGLDGSPYNQKANRLVVVAVK
jgi:SAM-dependent methyltransferase